MIPHHLGSLDAIQVGKRSRPCFRGTDGDNLESITLQQASRPDAGLFKPATTRFRNK